MKHIFFKFSKNIGLFGIAMLIGFSMFTTNCGGDDDNPVDDSDTEETDTTTTTADPMVFDSFSPGTGSYGDEITIYGENFDGDVEVTVNDKLQEDIVSVNDDGTELVFTLASNTYSGTVVLSRDDESDIESEDEFIYEITYDLDDLDGSEYFNDSRGGIDMVMLDDGSYYLANGFTLLKFNSDHEVTQEIIQQDYTSSPTGLFLGNNGILYIADSDGRILTFTEGDEFVDTLVKDVTSLNDTYFTGITGDSEYIYVTNDDGYQVVKIDVADSTNIEAIGEVDSDATISIDIDGDHLYVTTEKGAVKMHKETGDYTYIVDPELGNTFLTSGICIYPSGDIFIVENNSAHGGFYRISSTGFAKENDNLYQGVYVGNDDQLYILTSQRVKKLSIN